MPISTKTNIKKPYNFSKKPLKFNTPIGITNSNNVDDYITITNIYKHFGQYQAVEEALMKADEMHDAIRKRTSLRGASWVLHNSTNFYYTWG